MALRKIDHEEQMILSKKIERLKELHQIALANDVKAYTFQWIDLDKDLTSAIKNYQLVLDTDGRGLS